MQGRLSPIVDGRIQSFPWTNWREEIAEAARLGISKMEWTLDQERLYENPLMVAADQAEIRSLMEKHDFSIPSLTGDCFMQAPFWKAASEQEASALQKDFLAICDACQAIGIEMIVVPLVDNGSLETEEQENILVNFLLEKEAYFEEKGLKIIFESDFGPKELAKFIHRLKGDSFGINYDTGNSAALGFNPEEEISTYGSRIINVHIKDRVLGGTTVALGTGSTDFDAVFKALAHENYKNNYILQTARAEDDDHAGVLSKFFDMTSNWIESHGA
ncbi:TIM barrel protein [Terasakiella sp. A23]|uniref:sugar phosphate isomerase/epimerase family protein n=1 Tax=Terasakiella sp. FCG-A23 TaxID=3080561 RepID=UPI0029553E94|nr:TIM barrel protein [Terasakiella sp. A23]MDV7340797.1 TIM barrel protein [Terasakiella sp. A23]